MESLSPLARLVVKYRRYNPATGDLDVERTQLDYANMLGVSRVFITQISNGDREPGVDLLRALSRAFPAAADEIASVLKAKPEPVAALTAD